MRTYTLACLLVAAFLAATPPFAWAHAFPEHQTPGAGAELGQSPKAVTIRFDRAVEAAFSFLRVENASGKRVDTNDSHAMQGRADTLVVTLRALVDGRYHVYWTAVARDGHRTKGDYVFTVRKAAP
ncbi:MAG: copper resistance protein CopC [Mariprofundaceae bacterium]|nr:copper resistance protein CopC [Mariprofundaceae bacterium]